VKTFLQLLFVVLAVAYFKPIIAENAKTEPLSTSVSKDSDASKKPPTPATEEGKKKAKDARAREVRRQLNEIFATKGRL